MTELVVHSELCGFRQPSETFCCDEPIWAISTGKTATADGAGKVIALISRLFEERYGNEAAALLRILYGGSVTSANIGEFIAHPDIDGALVGGASITHGFANIVHKTAEAMQR